MANTGRAGLLRKITSRAPLIMLLVEAIAGKKRIEPVKNPGKIATAGGGGTLSRSRREFLPPEFDMEEITTAYNTESYVRQAIDKYVDMMFRAGWEFKGKNPKTVEYIKTRFRIMEEATGQSTESFLEEVADSLVKYANTFIVKARAKGNISIPGVRVSGYNGNPPVAGYFVLPTATVQIARDENGAIVRYQQQVPGQAKMPEFKPQDIIHIAWKKPAGEAFGVPYILPAIDDVRLLREIEDNVSNLLYKHLHPLYKFIVGALEAGLYSTPDEVEQVKEMIRNMPMDGTIVLPERYNVEVIGAQGSAINAEWALKYFENRVFTGLGVPPTVLGRAETANRSTADVLTVEMHDRAKAFQRCLQDHINTFIIKELLYEGGFDILLKPEDAVYFSFNEIAIEERIKIESQAVYLFEHNIATFEETRLRLGLEPTVDESRLYFNMIKIPEAIAGIKAQAEEGTPETNNKVKPANQHGKRSAPRRTAASVGEATGTITKYEQVLENDFESLKNDVISRVSRGRLDEVPMVAYMANSRMKKHAATWMLVSLRAGVQQAKKDCNVTRDLDIKFASSLQIVAFRSYADIDRFTADVERIASSSSDLVELRASLDAIRYRISFMSGVHLNRAYNYGYAIAAIAMGRTEFNVVSKPDACETCKGHKTLTLSSTSPIVEMIPSWHANCNCKLKVRE